MAVDTDIPVLDEAGRLSRIPCGRRSKWIVLAIWVLALVALGSFAGDLTGAQKNDSVEWLPGDAESTQVFKLSENFGTADEAPAVVVYERPSGITDADKAAAAADVAAFKSIENVIPDKVMGPVPSQDGQALQVLVPMHMGAGGWDQLANVVGDMKSGVGAHPEGLAFHITGPAGYAAGFGEAFKGIDGALLYAAAGVVIVVLFFTYGPLLWILPLLSAGVALTIAQAVIFGATKAGLTVNAQSAGILTVLVFGAGTDYALLLVARYREELRRHDDRHEAMAIALHRAGPAILASGATVIIAMLTLVVAQMNSTKGMGPVCAIGIAVALLAMLTLLPALLVIVSRWIFWPRHPNFGSADHTETGIWARVGNAIQARPRTVWVVTVLVLLALAAGVTGLKSDGIANKDAFVGQADAVDGDEILGKHFDIGTGNPVVVIANAAKSSEVAAAVGQLPGIKSSSNPVVKNDLVYVEATLSDAPDSPAAEATIDRARSTLHAIDGADAKVGGGTAVVLDSKRASSHDNKVIVPLVLVIVMLILMALLRAIVAPVILIATVVLSFFAALGLSRWLFALFGFNGSDPSLPLLGFVFLVALGIDYNIFLMSRVHEEAKRHGTRRGALIGLSATGGVITSAGLVLAGTFAVLATLPVVTFAQIGVVVTVGVLLDTLIVRSILVTSLSLDIGQKIWWPSSLARQPEPGEPDREKMPVS